MNFTSINFLLFLFAVIVVNYCLPKNRRWIFLLAASYFFYINWQPIYALLLLLTTGFTYVCGRMLDKPDWKKSNKWWILTAGCVFPLAILGLFKYFNFITASITRLLEACGIYLEMPTLDWLMPIGISFYTFTAIGYLVDVYRNTIRAERNFWIFSLFIGFFAQIASGPIPRGGQLIPQLRDPESLSYDNIICGLRTMLWGFFMKLCIANSATIYVDAIYNNMGHHNSSSLLLASVLYTFQIYCDFAGYSLIAIGASRMLGIRLMENFRRPYLASSIKDFWSRWHISLSTWFRDYVYFPLGGSRVSKSRNIFNLTATFLVSGLWHGAAWNFILWGGMHGAAQSAEKLAGVDTRKKRHAIHTLWRTIVVFIFINFLWVFFRLESMSQITEYFGRLFSQPGSLFIHVCLYATGMSIIILLIKDFVDEYYPRFTLLNSPNFIISNCATGLLIAYILLFGVFDSTSFIYFQF